MCHARPPNQPRGPIIIGKRVLRQPDIHHTYGLPKQTMYSLIHEGKFPEPTPISKRSVGWDADEVEAWWCAAKANRKPSQTKF